MMRVPVFLVLSVLFVGASRAEEPEMYLPGPGGNPADSYDRELWLDNPDFAASVGSSEMIGAHGLETEIANDLTLEFDACILKAIWWGAYWNGYETPTGAGFNLRFYMDAGCLPEVDPFIEYLLPGDDCFEELAPGGDMFSQFIYEYCLDVCLPPGLYWFSVQMVGHAFPSQWGRLGADQTLDCPSCIRSEYFDQAAWIPLAEIIGAEYDASQWMYDECFPPATRNTSWGNIRSLYR
jgi:hypothetical protein